MPDQPSPEPTSPSPGPPLEPKSDSFFDIVRQLGPASVLAVISLTLPALGGILLLTYINAVADWLTGHEDLGVFLYMLAFATLAGLALLPTYAQAILGGWAFGFGVGLPAALVGFLGGSMIGYVIARRASGERAMQVIDKRPAWSAVRDALISSSALKTLGLITLIRLPPNSPFAATNLLLASVKAPLPLYALGTLLGMTPRTAAAVWIAHGFHQQFQSVKEGLVQPKPWWMLALTVALVIAILILIGKIANRAIAKVAAESNESGE